MALELKQDTAKSIDTLWKTWAESSLGTASNESELEATFQNLNYTRFLDIIKTLRSLGLREEAQPPRLNIMVSGGLRFTLTGDSNIEAYCNDNEIKGKPFNVIMKTRALPDSALAEVDVADYNLRIKLRREQILSAKNVRVLSLLKTWSTQLKSFRYIQRYSFYSAKFPGLRFDASFVRQNAYVRGKDGRGGFDRKHTFQQANLGTQPLRFEMEVEALPGRGLKLTEFLTGISYVLRGIQNTYVITRKVTQERILELLSKLTRTRPGSFPGALPSTFERKNMDIVREEGVPNIRYTDYNCTDKADGVRCILVIDPTNGKLFMVDRNLNVIGTDRRLSPELAADWGGAVLDGEWVTQDLNNNRVSRYYAFDIFNFKRGEDVTMHPFYIRTSRPDEIVVSRLAALTDACKVLATADRMYKGIPPSQSFDVRQKIFYMPENLPDVDPLGIFRKAGDALRDVKTRAEYHTDGLIFTPNAAPLKKFGRWEDQLKWKPAEMNSIDFLVTFEKERTLEGHLSPNDQVMPRIHPETNMEVRTKTVYLHVGANILDQPRETILYKMALPRHGEDKRFAYRPVRFMPELSDPMASVCYLAINPGATDTAGAAPAARVIPSLADSADMVFCESGDHIADGAIVEMSYDPSQPIGWRWKPMRVRWDKTEQFSRGDIGGTLNNINTANNVWSSIHEPVTEYMIANGSMTPSEHEITEARRVAEPTKTVYYTHRAPEFDLRRISGMTAFHNHYIKENILLRRVLRPGNALLDMSVGQGGDLHKWVAAQVGFVLGCDIASFGITDKMNGAYARYMNKVIKAQSMGLTVPPMIFACADSSKRYSDGSAGLEEIDRQILRTMYGEDIPTAPPLAKQYKNLGKPQFPGFDVCAIMFALHYFFSDEVTLNGLLHNIHESLKVGGYFIGCCFDGDSVVRILRERRILTGEVLNGVDGESVIWSITKQYEGDALPATSEGLGKKIDVEFISIGQKLSEYLVSWTYLQSKMSEIGLELLNDDELEELGLSHSSNTFNVSHRMAEEGGDRYAMSDSQKQFSFLNRWFIFRRRELKNTLPELRTLPPPPPQPLPLPSPATSSKSNAAAVVAENAGEYLVAAPALYNQHTEVLDMNGVVGVISSVTEPVLVLYGPHAGENVHTYTLEFMDGGGEIAYEFDLVPIPGSDRLRYTRPRTPMAPPPTIPERGTPTYNAMLPLESNTPTSNSMPPLESNTPTSNSRLPLESDSPEAAEAEAAAEAAAEAEAASIKPKLELADGPIFQFFHQSASKDDLGIKNVPASVKKNWRRYLSPYAPFAFHDLDDPSIEYPSLEAAWYGTMIGIASNKPGLRGPMFSVESNTHQSAARARGEVAFNPEQIESYVEEGKKYYGLIDTDAKLKRTGIVIDKDIWEKRKEQVLIDLLQQRYDRDPVFKDIVDTIRAKKARVYFYSKSGKDSDLSGTLADGVIHGDNLLGRAIMFHAGLTY
jgi:hypothetical protein